MQTNYKSEVAKLYRFHGALKRLCSVSMPSQSMPFVDICIHINKQKHWPTSLGLSEIFWRMKDYASAIHYTLFCNAPMNFMFCRLSFCQSFFYVVFVLSSRRVCVFVCFCFSSSVNSNHDTFIHPLCRQKLQHNRKCRLFFDLFDDTQRLLLDQYMCHGKRHFVAIAQ